MTIMNKNARIAGFLYLLIVIADPIRMMYIPSTLFVSGNAAATVNNIVAHEALFRFGIATALFGGAVGILLALALYRLLKDVDGRLALMMLVLGVVPGILAYVNVINDFAALTFAHGTGFADAFDKPQRDAFAMLFIHLYGREIVAAEIFWGLWLFPLAVLTYRSDFLPRWLGVWLIINGLAYLALSFTGVLLPQYESMVNGLLFPALFGEVAFMLWLLVMGARRGFRHQHIARSAGVG